MNKFALLFGLSLAACVPNDFPPRPHGTIIVEFPTPLAATLVATPRIKPIPGDDRSNATALFYVIKTSALAVNNRGFAGNVLYPVRVNLNGQGSTISTQADFIKSYSEIFNDKLMKSLESADEDNLFITFNGVQVGTGVFWFNQFCTNAACTQGRFLITEINN